MSPRPPTVMLMAGLQGSGKTTCCAKLATPLPVRRARAPAGRLRRLPRPPPPTSSRCSAARSACRCYREDGDDPVAIAEHGFAEARRTGRDVVIVDTAGRLTVDEEMMDELVAHPGAPSSRTAVVLVLDAMTGQTAVEVAQAFQRGRASSTASC